MVSDRKVKGDIATVKAIADLTEKGYVILTPTVCEHLPFDFIAYKDGISLRIQAKYSSTGIIVNKNVWNDKNGSHKKTYLLTDFDYYAIYIPQINKICYPNINFGGCNINFVEVKSSTPYYWYEDFLEFTDVATKRKATREQMLSRKPPTFKNGNIYKPKTKIIWPEKEELEKMIWEKSTLQLSKELGVSDVAITKMAKRLGIKTPSRGYWTKVVAGKILPGQRE